MMKCPNCGAAKLARDTRDLTCTYHGVSMTLPRVTGAVVAMP
jgi:HTH-type transcriptional regulator / antitoxin MqsA